MSFADFTMLDQSAKVVSSVAIRYVDTFTFTSGEVDGNPRGTLSCAGISTILNRCGELRATRKPLTPLSPQEIAISHPYPEILGFQPALKALPRTINFTLITSGTSSPGARLISHVISLTFPAQSDNP
jgi:hypothetical protein